DEFCGRGTPMAGNGEQCRSGSRSVPGRLGSSSLTPDHCRFAGVDRTRIEVSMTPWKEWSTASVENRLLTFLEEREARIASLGILDTRHQTQELLETFCLSEPAISAVDAARAMANLVDDHSVIVLEGGPQVGGHGDEPVGGEHVRSHVAELVRLL